MQVRAWTKSAQKCPPSTFYTGLRKNPHKARIPCDSNGRFLPPHTPPPPRAPSEGVSPNPWRPFGSRLEFDFAHYHFVELQSSGRNIDKALDMWAASVMEFGGNVPWKNSADLYRTIDAIQHGDAPWKVYQVHYQGPLPPGTPPKWMTESYELCMRDARQVLHHQLSTREFSGNINYAPYKHQDADGQRVWSNLMSADWAWKQADAIAKDRATHGAMFVPIIAGSDKTTVSVATGNQEYHPVYMSPGNLSNIARRAHTNAFLPIAFLPIPKTSKKNRKAATYQTFCRQMYHASLSIIFEPLKPGMSAPEVIKCPDGHFRRAIYGLGPYIADYPEQVWLAAIVQGWCPKCDAPPHDLDCNGSHRRSERKTEFLIGAWDPGTLWTTFGVRADVVPFTHSFPRADIHELLSPDLLHQVIKGTFKDHLVTWVNEYLLEEHREARGLDIIADIDRRISAVPPFPGLRRFPDGRDFKQWTGDDSKALMKVYLGAIAGHVPDGMVKSLAAFLDFCYIARRNAITSEGLKQLEHALDRFHVYRDVFVGTAGVSGDQISLPRQHSLKHYVRSIRLFGSPNGLCSSITESKHIKAVKEPWRRSNRFQALAQMLQTNCRMDKLAAAHQVLTTLGMMDGTTSSHQAMLLRGEQPQPRPRVGAMAAEDNMDDDDHGPAPGPKSLSSVELAHTPARGYPRTLRSLAIHIDQPEFPAALRRFLYDQVNPDSDISPADVDINDCPDFTGRIVVFQSAVACFYAPSDLCGAGGMYHERIRSHQNWKGKYPRYDTMFIKTGPDSDPMYGMTIGRALLFFSFTFREKYFPCVLVNWYVPGNAPDENTGMWVVQPEFADCVARAAHLLPVYGTSFIPEDFQFYDSLDAFRAYFVNNVIDHHTHEFLS
ncbi:hypothetical protein BGW80DRAFT_1438862 [Lactifluus volemus]|nr:hypothetical protein BGW80DRAFT_1438862 [Lactifluus volemus]